jgi:phytoene dehydrogenase-like protein
VTLADGSDVSAPVVAASCDPKQTFLGLLPSTSVGAQLEHRIDRLRTAGTTAKVDLALSGPLRFASRPETDVERARTGRTLDGMERAFDAVKYRQCSSAPLLDIYIPTIADPGLAPGGGHVVSILAHYAPYELEGGWINEEREALGDAVMTELERFAPGAGANLIAREVLTPVDIERRYGVTGGHPHHAEHALDQLLTRPCPECARYATPVGGLYLCGGGSHPGGGLTGLPGLLAAGEIIKR